MIPELSTQPDGRALQLLAELTPGRAPGEPLETVRARYDADAARLAQLGDWPAPVGAVSDLSIRGVLCRRYEPLQRKQDLTLIFLHGGGWVIGSLVTHDHLCRSLAGHLGIELLSVGYRLAPENPYPAALKDAEAVLSAVSGGVVLGGDSSGANLAAGLAIRARDQGRPVAAQLLAYPPLDPTCSTVAFGLDPRWPPNRTTMRQYWDEYLANAGGEAVPPDAAPLFAKDLAGLAPALVLTAEWDPLKDDGARYAQRLVAADVHAAHMQLPGMIHGFLRVPSSRGFRLGLEAAGDFLEGLSR